ncbi:hypothetical protein Aduo_006407 [Ancylostoma duodenale]
MAESIKSCKMLDLAREKNKMPGARRKASKRPHTQHGSLKTAGVAPQQSKQIPGKQPSLQPTPITAPSLGAARAPIADRKPTDKDDALCGTLARTQCQSLTETKRSRNVTREDALLQTASSSGIDVTPMACEN